MGGVSIWELSDFAQVAGADGGDDHAPLRPEQRQQPLDLLGRAAGSNHNAVVLTLQWPGPLAQSKACKCASRPPCVDEQQLHGS